MTQFSRLGLLLVTSMIATACSSGGGSSNASTGGRASGPLSVPDATCDGAPCMGGASLVSGTSVMASTSGSIVLNNGVDVYSYFSETIIPGVNEALYAVESVALENNLDTCEKIEEAADETGGTALGYPLGGDYTVDIANAALKTIPTGMTDGGQNMVKGFIFKKSLVGFAEVQIKCNSATQRTLYVRVKESATKSYEFWSQDDGAKRTIYGALDNGSTKITFYFNTADGSTFELHGVANNISRHGGGLVESFSIAGGAVLATGAADIAWVGIPGNIAANEGYEDESSTSSDDVRHCYNTISPIDIEPAASAGTCGNLVTPGGPPASPLRTGAPLWTVNGMLSSDINTAF